MRYLLVLFVLTLPVFAQEVGEPAPDFALLNRAGQKVSLAELSGTPVVLNFWATWCLPCLDELPIFQRASEEVGEGATFLLVNNNERAEAAAAYLEAQGITLPAGLEPTRRERAELELDTTTAVLRRYQVLGIPTTFFIDAEGVVQSVKPGPLSAAELSERLLTLGITWIDE